MKKLFLSLLYLVVGSIASTQTWAQQSVSAPVTENPPSSISPPSSSLVAHNTSVVSSHPVTPSSTLDPNVTSANKTKVLRIYGGAGFFDLALAEELRPKLGKALAVAQIDSLKTAPRQVTVPLQSDSKRKIPVVSNL